jgi:outer membrane usher protein FimD/PapC
MPSRSTTLGLSVALIAVATLAVSAAAQSFGTDGLQLSFGINLRTSAEDNRDLDPDNSETSSETEARLSFGILSETQTDRLALDFSGTLRAIDAPDGSTQANGFVDPGVSLSYGRSSAAARLDLSGSLQESELSQDFLDGDVLDGEPIELVTGTATRRRTSVGASVNWGDDTPLGFGLFTRVQETTYRDGTASGLDDSALEDNRRRTVGVTTRMDLNQVRRLNLGLTWSDFEEIGVGDKRETLSLNATLTQDRPLGALSVGLNVTDTEEGQRYNTNLGRSLDMPLGRISGQIGLSRSTSGSTYLSGGLNLSRDLARGALTFGLSRDVSSSDTDDSEQVSTRASMGLTQELTELSQIRFGLNLIKAEGTNTGAQTVSGDIGATFSHDLPKDWTLATGYNHRVRNKDDEGVARSNRVFLELRRTFITRF